MKRKYPLLFTPGPLQTSKMVRRTLAEANLTHRDYIFADVFKEVQKKLLIAFEVSDAYFTCIFTTTGRGANEAMIIPYVLNCKPLFVTNGSWGNNLIEIAKYHVSNLHILRLPSDIKINPVTIKAYLKNNRDIDTVVVVHQETRSGILNPLDSIARIVKELGKTLVVDAISSTIVEETNFEKLGIDIFSASSAKGLRSVPGLGIVCGKIKEFEKMKNYRGASYYLDLYAEYRKQRYDKGVRFAESVPLIVALNEALNELLKEGIKRRRILIRERTVDFRRWAKSLGLTSPFPESELGCVATTFILPYGITYKKFINDLSRKNIFLLYGDKESENQFQVSFLGALKNSEVLFLKKTLIEILRRYKKMQHYDFKSSL